MGGILRKLSRTTTTIIVAYMTSGNIAVFDHDVRRYVDFLERLAAEGRIDREQVEPLAEEGARVARREDIRAKSTFRRFRTSSASSARPKR